MLALSYSRLGSHLTASTQWSAAVSKACGSLELRILRQERLPIELMLTESDLGSQLEFGQQLCSLSLRHCALHWVQLEVHVCACVKLLVVHQQRLLVLVLRLDQALQELLVVLGPLPHRQLCHIQDAIFLLQDDTSCCMHHIVFTKLLQQFEWTSWPNEDGEDGNHAEGHTSVVLRYLQTSACHAREQGRTLVITPLQA